MSFLDGIAERFGFTRKAVSGESLLAAINRGNGMSPRPTIHNMKDYLGRYADQAWVYACIKIIQSKGAGVPLKVYRKNGDSLDEDPQHPLKTLLDRVNPMQSGYDLREATHGYMELAGNSYWLLDKMVNGKPTEIWPLNPQFIEIKGTKDDFVTGYEYKINGVVVEKFKKEEILHFKYWNPLDDYYGLSPLAAGRDSSDSMMHADRFNKTFFENSAEPGGILTADGAIQEDAAKRIRSVWENAHQGSRKAHKVAILHGGLKFQSTTMTHHDMQFPELKRMTREDILAVFGIPPVMVGVFDEANYANSREQRRIFWMDSMKPRLSKIESVINEFLVKPFDSNVIVAYDLSNVEDIQDDKKARAEEDEILTRSGVLLINEVRERRNLAPVPWGDTWNAPMGLMPIDAPRAPEVPLLDGPDDEEEIDEEEEDEKAVTVAALPAPLTKDTPEDVQKKRRDTVWAAFKGQTESMERRWFPVLRKLFTEQEKEVIRKLQDSGWKEFSAQIKLNGMKDVKQSIDLVLFDRSEARRVFRKAGRQLLEATLTAKAKAEMDAYNLGTFNVTSPRVQKWLDEKAFRFANELNETTEEALRKELTEAINAGEAIGDVEKRLEEVFDMARGYRTERIARTEVISASNAGSMLAYEESGVVQQTEWITARDEKVRDSHQIDGQTANLGQGFTLKDGISLKYPGDPAGAPEDIINCRCTIAPVVSRR